MKETVNTKLKKNDKVMVISGKYKGKTGVIKEMDLKENRVLVEGINMLKKYVKKSQENPQGAIIEKEGFIDLSNVMFYDGKNPVRLGYKVEGDKKVRYSKKDGKVVG